jgi:hypothetical protein
MFSASGSTVTETVEITVYIPHTILGDLRRLLCPSTANRARQLQAAASGGHWKSALSSHLKLHPKHGIRRGAPDAAAALIIRPARRNQGRIRRQVQPDVAVRPCLARAPERDRARERAHGCAGLLKHRSSGWRRCRARARRTSATFSSCRCAAGFSCATLRRRSHRGPGHAASSCRGKRSRN